MNLQISIRKNRAKKEEGCDESAPLDMKLYPVPPPLPCRRTIWCRKKGPDTDGSSVIDQASVSTATTDTWDRLFDEALGADVRIRTDNGGIIYAHSSILGMASPVLQGMLKQSKSRGRWRSIAIRGVPHEAARVFVRFLYSSRFEKEELEDVVLHLLVLSHVYTIPHLKRLCERTLEGGMVSTDNLVDVFQLALLCDTPRLSLICHRMILKHFKAIVATEGWKAMKQSHPVLEKVILESMIDADSIQKARLRKAKEWKMYLQLYDAMEALVHICKDGCKTIGPHDKVFKADQAACKFESCKGLELLVRHFAGCKLRVPGGCVHCKRMWQLLELHSHLCADSDACRVPLCLSFKSRVKKQSKKDAIKWRLLVRNILRSKRIGGSPFFLSGVTLLE